MGIIGVAYVILEYIPSIEPPQNMRYVILDGDFQLEGYDTDTGA